MINPFTLISENIRLKKQNTKLAVKNIILWADLRTIAGAPMSEQAKRIIARYQKQLETERKQEQASQN
jgi:hypothetical protein